MNQFAAGDLAKVELDSEVLKLLQEEHGGWDDSIAGVSGHYSGRNVWLISITYM